MRATLYRLRIELRGSWQGWLALALIVGIAGGAVLALAAGARRTDSSYRRFLRTPVPGSGRRARQGTSPRSPWRSASAWPLEAGRGRSAVAVRSSLAAVTLGIATLVAAITFGAGLSHGRPSARIGS